MGAVYVCIHHMRVVEVNMQTGGRAAAWAGGKMKCCACALSACIAVFEHVCDMCSNISA